MQRKTFIIICMALVALGLLDGCSKTIGDYTVKPVIDAALRNSQKESQDISRQMQSGNSKQLTDFEQHRTTFPTSDGMDGSSADFGGDSGQ